MVESVRCRHGSGMCRRRHRWQTRQAVLGRISGDARCSLRPVQTTPDNARGDGSSLTGEAHRQTECADEIFSAPHPLTGWYPGPLPCPSRHSRNPRQMPTDSGAGTPRPTRAWSRNDISGIYDDIPCAPGGLPVWV